MKIKKSRGDRIFDVCNILFMCLVMAVMLLPMLHVVSISFSDSKEAMKGGLLLFPRKFSLEAYQFVFKEPAIYKSYLNTIMYAVGGTICTLLITSLTAYPLSISDFCLKKFVTVFLTITMFIGGGMIPTYITIKNLGLIDNRLVMIIPGCVGAYNVILFRTFFQGLPSSLREAARIDGAGEYRILFSMVLPLSKPILATVGLFTMVGKWNEWFSAMLYLNDAGKHPVQMILRQMLFTIQGAKTINDPRIQEMLRQNAGLSSCIKMATIVVIMFPIICIYPFIQKYFVKGVFVGTIKG